MAEKTYQLAFIGAGRMASAMIRSLLDSGSIKAENLACGSANDGTAEALVTETGIGFIDLDANESFRANTLVLACKPQQIHSLAPCVTSASEGAMVISILAGTRIATLQKMLPRARTVVRTMPNTPGSIGAGISGFTPSTPLEDTEAQTVAMVLGAMGEFLEVTEAEIDAITAVSGSGPAYLFYFVECLRNAAQQVGFSSEVATKLARTTVIGAAKLLEHSGESAESLRSQVTSKGGTTQAAIESLQEQYFEQVICRAVQAAHSRAIELGSQESE